MTMWRTLSACVLALVMLAGCPPQRISEQVTVVGVPETDPLVVRIRKDYLEVLQTGLDRYSATVKDYTCTLYKQERLDPKGAMLPEQKILCKFLDRPFSVFTDTVVNARGASRALYVEGRWGNRMLAQPAGLGGVLLGTMAVDPRGSQVRANTLRFIDQFGFRRSLEAMMASYAAARKEGILKLTILGEASIDGRLAIVVEGQVRESRPSGRFEYPRVRTCLDREWLLPTAVDIWDGADVHRGQYRYADVRFNVGLTDRDFAPEAHGMKPPKESPAAQPTPGE